MDNNAIYTLVDQWPADLLIDYILKIHHRGIRTNGPRIAARFRRVLDEQPDNENLRNVYALFEESLADLEMHLMKEENVLFPFILELCDADATAQPVEQMHCGSVENPIRVMLMEHEGETNRYAAIARLTNNFAIPADSTDDFRLLMPQLEAFMNALHEHIALENEHLFPKAVELENEWVK